MKKNRGIHDPSTSRSFTPAVRGGRGNLPEFKLTLLRLPEDTGEDFFGGRTTRICSGTEHFKALEKVK
jgi:hypothetical protein